MTVEELVRVYGEEPVLDRVLVREEDSRLRAQAAPHLPNHISMQVRTKADNQTYRSGSGIILQDLARIWNTNYVF